MFFQVPANQQAGSAVRFQTPVPAPVQVNTNGNQHVPYNGGNFADAALDANGNPIIPQTMNCHPGALARPAPLYSLSPSPPALPSVEASDANNGEQKEKEFRLRGKSRLLDASPITFRVTCITNRSTITNLDSQSPAEKAKKKTDDDSAFIPPSNPFAMERVKYPFHPGQRLVVQILSNMRIREEGLDNKLNPVVSVLEKGQLVFFIRAGKDGNRIKVQTQNGKQGWTSWVSSSTKGQILAVHAQGV